MVEDGLRELAIINLQNKSIYYAETSPYEYGFYFINIPPGQYAIYYAKWIFIDANAIALYGVNRQVEVEIKFSDRSYNLSAFEARTNEIKLAGSYFVDHNSAFKLNRGYNDKLFVFLDKMKSKLSSTDWLSAFKKEIGLLLRARKARCKRFLN